MADELQLMQDYIFDRLAGDAQLAGYVGGSANPRIFVGAAEQGTPFPFILIEHISPALGGDLLVIGGDVVQTTQAWRVTARKDGRSMKALSPVVSRLDALLHRPRQGPFPVVGGAIQMSLRDPGGAYQRTLIDDAGRFYSVKGHDYIIAAQAA